MEKITIGGQDFEVRPLTIGQIEKIVPLMDRMADGNGPAFSATIDILQVALVKHYPDVDVRELPAAPGEIIDGLTKILAKSGLQSGEAKAGGKPTSKRSAAD